MLLEPSPALDTSPISTSSGVLIRLEEQSNVVYLYLFAWCDPPILLLGSCAPFSCNLACMPDDAIGDLLKTFRAMFVRNIAVELEAASSSDAELSSKTSESEVHREGKKGKLPPPHGKLQGDWLLLWCLRQENAVPIW